MRKTVLLVLCYLSASFLYSQNIFLGGSIDDYVGTWRYENKDSNLVFTIKLKKSEMTPNEKTYQCVVGTYAMTRNGITVVDNMKKFDILSSPHQYPISGVDFKDVYDRLDLGFIDDLYGKYTVSGTLSLIPLKDGKFNLRWILKEEEGDFVYDWNEVIPPSGFSVPDNIVLVKIE